MWIWNDLLRDTPSQNEVIAFVIQYNDADADDDDEKEERIWCLVVRVVKLLNGSRAAAEAAR